MAEEREEKKNRFERSNVVNSVLPREIWKLKNLFDIFEKSCLVK